MPYRYRGNCTKRKTVSDCLYECNTISELMTFLYDNERELGIDPNEIFRDLYDSDSIEDLVQSWFDDRMSYSSNSWRDVVDEFSGYQSLIDNAYSDSWFDVENMEEVRNNDVSYYRNLAYDEISNYGNVSLDDYIEEYSLPNEVIDKNFVDDVSEESLLNFIN